MSLLDKASLIVTPNSYKESVLYSVVPNTTLGDMTVVRATTATRVNSAGLIENVGVNIPRIDYTNGSCPSLLVEPQRTNLALYSEQFENANWYKNNVTVTANSIISPSGTLTADTFTIPSAGYGIFQVVNVSPSSTYTFSFYAKKGTNTSYILDVIDGSTFTSFTTVDYSSQLNSNWVRVSATFTTVSTTTSVRAYLIRDGSSVGNGYFWGAQLEVGSYATSYIPTVATSVTRNADVISKTGISSLIGQTEGTLFCEMNTQISTANNWFQIWDGGSNNWIFIGLDQNKIRGYIRLGADTVFDSNTFDLTNNVSYKIALAYKNQDCAFYINGVQILSNSLSFTVSNTISQVIIGDRENPVNDAVKYKSLQIYKTRLTNTELASLTTL